MTRWALPCNFWSGFATPASCHRISHTYYSIKSPRPFYSSAPPAAPAPYRLKSRISVYDKAGPSRTTSTYTRTAYPSYQSTSGGYGTYDCYGTAHGRSSYYAPTRNAYNSYHDSYRRSSAGYGNSGSNKKTVHWDESTFRGSRGTKHDGERRRHHRHRSDGEQDYGYDRHGRVSASSNTYYHTGAMSGRDHDYYRDDTKRRSHKSRDYRSDYYY